MAQELRMPLWHLIATLHPQHKSAQIMCYIQAHVLVADCSASHFSNSVQVIQTPPAIPTALSNMYAKSFHPLSSNSFVPKALSTLRQSFLGWINSGYSNSYTC